jgi:hypothetical protein
LTLQGKEGSGQSSGEEKLPLWFRDHNGKPIPARVEIGLPEVRKNLAIVNPAAKYLPLSN